VAQTVQHGEHTSQSAVPPQQLRQMLGAIAKSIGRPQAPVTVVVSTATRFFMQQMVEATIPNVYFLSHNEIPAGTKVMSLGVIQ